jgi:hypothetical protein
MEATTGRLVEVAGGLLRMKSGLEQDLVGVDVADAGKQSLVHEHRLESTSTVSKQLAELGLADCQRVRPELSIGDEPVGIVDESDAAQPTLVDQGKRSSVPEVQDESGVLRQRVRVSRRREVAGHSEVLDQPGAVDLREQMLAVPTGRRELTPAKDPPQPVPLHAVEQARIAYLDATDLPVQAGVSESATERLDVWELRQGAHPATDATTSRSLTNAAYAVSRSSVRKTDEGWTVPTTGVPSSSSRRWPRCLVTR